MAKKYYWLKLMNNFFQQPKIKKLRKIAGGDTYTVIYLKIQLLSIKNEGKVFFEGIETNFAEEIALTIDEDVENVEVTLSYLIAQGLIQQLSDTEYLLPETLNLIGSETASAQRVRQHRNQKALQCNTTVTQCNTDVTKCNTDVTKCNTEIEIEKDIDIEIEKDIEKEKRIKSQKNKCEEYKEISLTDEESEKIRQRFYNWKNKFETLSMEYEG